MTGWAGFPDLFNDVAYYQGDYWSPPESSGVIVQTARCNQGAYSETTWGAKQLQNARAQAKDVGHYIFNGNLDPYTVGTLWGATCRRNGFDPATEVLAYDCEDEGATGTHAWGPDQVIAAQHGFNSVFGPVPWQSVRAYMNWDVNHRFDWSGLVTLGAQLWYARPGGPLDQAYWPTVWAKQDGTFQGVDANGYTKTFAASNGVARRKGAGSMSTVYSSTMPTPVPADYIPVGGVAGSPIWALAGDGRSSEAGFLETQDQNLANAWAGVHSVNQGSVPLSWASYQDFKKKYQAVDAQATVTLDAGALTPVGDAVGDAVKDAVTGLSFAVTGQIKEG